jgi:MerR family transcriptional regulator, light-induced transcriptional regulator
LGQVATARSLPFIDHSALRRLETHFIAPHIYQRDDVAARQAKLARMVSSQILPRLLHLHADDTVEVAPIAQMFALDAGDIGGLADIVLGSDLEAAATYVVALRDRGLSMEKLFVELLEPTARHLGVLWDNDECDFIDVTLGVARLQKLLAIFNATHELPALDTKRRVLMAAAPGNQHSFGGAMVEKFLRAGGWDVQTATGETADAIADVAKHEWFAVVGLTMGSATQLGGLAETITKLRAKSLNSVIGIMVGGPAFTENPRLADEVGADATAPNAPAAVLVAQKLFDLGAFGLAHAAAA